MTVLIWLICYFDEIWTISDGSGGESYTVGRAESESEAEIAEQPRQNDVFEHQHFESYMSAYIHPTRCIVYSASFSGNLEGHFWRCVRLFRVVFWGILE